MNIHYREVKIVPKPISLFLVSMDNQYMRLIRCINCGRPFCIVTNHIACLVDNSGQELPDLPETGKVIIQCHSCKQEYHLHI
jgi:hypothetical protein